MKKAEHEQIQLQKSSLKSQRHIVQLCTVYCMAKNGISARNFEPLMKLQQVNGCTHADDYYKKLRLAKLQGCGSFSQPLFVYLLQHS